MIGVIQIPACTAAQRDLDQLEAVADQHGRVVVGPQAELAAQQARDAGRPVGQLRPAAPAREVVEGEPPGIARRVVEDHLASSFPSSPAAGPAPVIAAPPRENSLESTLA